MKYKYDGFNWLVRLERGEKLVEQLTSFVRAQKVTGAWISGLGTASWVEVGFFEIKNQKYDWQTINDHLEILSLTGNVSWDGQQPTLHIHGSFSDSKMQSVGGHVRELEVAATCEIFLHFWDSEGLQRKLDKSTGLKLLDL